MKNIVEKVSGLNTGMIQEKPIVYTTDEIKNNEYFLCEEWVKKWRFDDATARMDVLRNEIYELEQENRELKRAYTNMWLIRSLSHISWMFGVCLYLYYIGTDEPNSFILLILSAATLISFVYSVILTDEADKE